MKNITLYFYECEHNGDLDNYLEDVQESGGRVVSEQLNTEAETAEVIVEVEDIQIFLKKFKETDACGFSQYGN